jgi:hypothetical protein
MEQSTGRSASAPQERLHLLYRIRETNMLRPSPDLEPGTRQSDFRAQQTTVAMIGRTHRMVNSPDVIPQAVPGDVAPLRFGYPDAPCP